MMNQSITRGSILICLFYTLLGVCCLTATSSANANKYLEDSLAIIKPVADTCVADMARFCDTLTSEEDHIVDCLYNKRVSVSDGCKKELATADPRIRDVAREIATIVNSCIEDVSQYCATVKPGGGRWLKCLNMNIENVSTEYIAAIKKSGYQ